MSALTVEITKDQCCHRPQAGSVPCDLGLWWHEDHRVLWVGGLDFLGEGAIEAFLYLLHNEDLTVRQVNMAVGKAALTVFGRSFPACLGEANSVIVDVCSHEEGKGVTL